MTTAVQPLAQPAKGVLAVRRITIRRAAAAIGISELVLGRILNGHERASPRVRAALAAHLKVRETELFRGEATR